MQGDFRSTAAKELSLEKIKLREQAATPETWLKGEGDSGIHQYLPPDDFEKLLQIRETSFGPAPEFRREADADFCAHARQDIPALIAEVEKLRKIKEAVDALIHERFRPGSTAEDVQKAVIHVCDVAALNSK